MGTCGSGTTFLRIQGLYKVLGQSSLCHVHYVCGSDILVSVSVTVPNTSLLLSVSSLSIVDAFAEAVSRNATD